MSGSRGLAKKLKAALFRVQGGRCCYCGRAVELAPEPWGMGEAPPDSFATLEHLRRKVDGGRLSPDNVALACWPCNNQRGDLSWVEFATLRQSGVAA